DNGPRGGLTESRSGRGDRAGEQLAKYLLFADETRLTDPVNGTSGFAEEFAQRGPFDRHGRSLREFDLSTRLFKHPCSYLIYSSAFDGLPASVKERTYRRLWDVLNGKESGKDFAHLNPIHPEAIHASFI